MTIDRKPDEKASRKRWIRGSAATAPDSLPPSVASDTDGDRLDSHRESGLLDGGVQTRRTSDGEIRNEAPRIDFQHLTSVDDQRALKREARSDLEIHQDLRDSKNFVPETPCHRHGVPGCGPCKSLDELRRKHQVTVTKLSPSMAPPARQSSSSNPRASGVSPHRRGEPSIAKPLVEIDVERVRQAWGLAEVPAKKKLKQAAIVTQAEDTEKARDKVPQVGIPDLCSKHGYNPRQLALFLDLPGFVGEKEVTDYDKLSSGKFLKWYMQIIAKTRKRYPRTLGELVNSLPRKTVPRFSAEEIRFCKNYAPRKYNPQQMQDRIFDGVYKPLRIDDFTIREIQNGIIRRAWDLRLLNFKTRGGIAHDFDRELEADHDAEIKSGNFGDTTVTGGFRSTPGKMFQAKPMNSFERGPIHTHRADGAVDESEDGDSVSDDYEEDLAP
jgi:hypothetical protein